MAKNVMKGNMEEVLGSHQQFVAFTSLGNVTPGVAPQGHTSHVFGIVKRRTLSPRGMKEQIHLRASSQTSEFSSVVAARRSTKEGCVVRIANHRSTKDPDEIVRRDDSTAQAGQVSAVGLAHH